MCGICGVRADAGTGQDTTARVAKALAMMNDRGPDDSGIYAVRSNAGSTTLGMSRLRVRSALDDPIPFQLSDGRKCAFNGEVYREYAGARPSSVSGGSREAAAVTLLGGSPDGMWAAIEVGKSGDLLCNRDPWGIKPLWFTRDGKGGVAQAASRPRLLRDGHTLRFEAIAQFLRYGRVVDGGSFWNGIHEVPRGAHGDLTKREPEQRLPDMVDEARTLMDRGDADCIDRAVRSSLLDSVQECLKTDRQVGLALSGGLDSTILAHHASALKTVSLRTVSVLVEGAEDGLFSLDALPVRYPTTSWTHHTTTVGPSDYLALLERAVHHLQAPTGLSSAPLYMALSDLASKNGITVLMVGEGADEVWSGYRSYLEISPQCRPEDFYANQAREQIVGELLGDEACQQAAAAARENLPDGCGLAAIMAAERDFSLGPLLERTDALTMANSIEARTPFLQGHSWAIASLLSSESHLTRDQTKTALRRAYRAPLPSFQQEIKKPFRAPWNAWLTNELSQSVPRRLKADRDVLEAIGIRYDAVPGIVERAVLGEAAAAQVTLCLLTLGMWGREIL